MMHRKATPKGQMSNSGMGPAISHLPIQLKLLFEPRPPLEFKAPLIKRKLPPYTGICQYISEFETTDPPARVFQETPIERKEKMKVQRHAKAQEVIETQLKDWDPQSGDHKTEDAYKTLFVGRISIEATEKQLVREMERFGPVKKVRMVEDHEGKPRGYAFVEFEDEADLKSAFKNADAKKIEGRRIVVDVERGRTVRDWKPRRLGGGIGDTRKGGEDVNVKYSGRDPISSYGRSSDYSQNYSSSSRRTSTGGDSNNRYGGSSNSSRSDRYGSSRGSGEHRGDYRSSSRKRSRSRDRGNSYSSSSSYRRVGEKDDGHRDRRQSSSSSYGNNRY